MRFISNQIQLIMAIVTEPYLEGLSGMLGKSLVFRTLNGRTIVQAAPVRKVPFNKAQRASQQRFRQAMAYARELVNNPDVKAKYAARAKEKGNNCNAFNIAVSEYLQRNISGE